MPGINLYNELRIKETLTLGLFLTGKRRRCNNRGNKVYMTDNAAQVKSQVFPLKAKLMK